MLTTRPILLTWKCAVWPLCCGMLLWAISVRAQDAPTTSAAALRSTSPTAVVMDTAATTATATTDTTPATPPQVADEVVEPSAAEPTRRGDSGRLGRPARRRTALQERMIEEIRRAFTLQEYERVLTLCEDMEQQYMNLSQVRFYRTAARLRIKERVEAQDPDRPYGRVALKPPSAETMGSLPLPSEETTPSAPVETSAAPTTPTTAQTEPQPTVVTPPTPPVTTPVPVASTPAPITTPVPVASTPAPSPINLKKIATYVIVVVAILALLLVWVALKLQSRRPHTPVETVEEEVEASVEPDEATGEDDLDVFGAGIEAPEEPAPEAEPAAPEAPPVAEALPEDEAPASDDEAPFDPFAVEEPAQAPVAEAAPEPDLPTVSEPEPEPPAFPTPERVVPSAMPEDNPIQFPSLASDVDETIMPVDEESMSAGLEAFEELIGEGEDSSAPSSSPPAEDVTLNVPFQSLTDDLPADDLPTTAAPSLSNAPPSADSSGGDTIIVAPPGGEETVISSLTEIGLAAGGGDDDTDKDAPQSDLFEREFQKGQTCYDQGDWRQAVHHLSIAAALRPDDPEARQKLREARARRG